MLIVEKKRGALVPESIIKLILAVAVIIILGILFFTLLSPFFDKGDATSEAYFESLENEIKIAKDGGIGEFFIWDIETGDATSYHLVYFGNRLLVEEEGIGYTSKGEENNICVCSTSLDKGICNYCSSLENPSSIDGEETEFVVSKGEKVSIEFRGDRYEFKKV